MYFIFNQTSADALLTKQNAANEFHQLPVAILAGDSAHSFPPDLGQGINSGLDDVFELDKALLSANGDIYSALPLYENMRSKEIAALCKLMTFAYPYQYNQSPIKSKLYLLNFSIRLFFNKLFPRVFAAPAFFLVQNHKLSYTDIMKKVNSTSKLLLLLSMAITGTLLRIFFFKF
jgi:2-polyprenyl-6-methoxyphenol hydroxylase-like FAD-dependent oxidoreductase